MNDETMDNAETGGDVPRKEMPWWAYLVPLIVAGFLLFFTLVYWQSRVGTPGPVPPVGSVGSAAETPQAAPPGQPATANAALLSPPDSDSTAVDTTARH
jgi:hypothetical protein